MTQPTSRLCVECGSPITEGASPARKCCSAECKKVRRRKQGRDQARAKRWDGRGRLCLNCGGQVPDSADGRAHTCSPECRAEYRRKKNHEYTVSHRAHTRMQRGIVRTEHCDICGSEIPQWMPASRTLCSEECRKVARRLSSRRRYRDNPNVVIPMACEYCGSSLPEWRDGHIKFCSDRCRKAHSLEYAKEWNAENRDHVRECGYSADRRARKRAAFVAPVDRYAIYDRDGGRCYMCGVSVEVDAFHVDHLIPLFYGGTHEPNNVGTSCSSCNLEKHTRIIPEAVQKRGANMVAALATARKEKGFWPLRYLKVS